MAGAAELFLSALMPIATLLFFMQLAMGLKGGNVKNKLINKISMGKKFPIDVIIIEERAGGSFIIDHDEKATRRTKEDGNDVYHLMNRNEETKPFPPESIYIGSRRNNVAIMKKTGVKMYTPMKMVGNDNLRPITDDERHFFANAVKRSTQYKPDDDFRDKLLRAIPVIAVGIMLLMWGLGWKEIVAANQGMAGSSAAAAASAERAAELQSQTVDRLVAASQGVPYVEPPKPDIDGRAPGG